MKAHRFFAVLMFYGIALSGFGFPNPIEDQATVTINHGDWDVGPLLYIGKDTQGNVMNVIDGYVDNTYGYLGYAAGSSNNSVAVHGSHSSWTNQHGLYIGNYGGGNTIVITDGGYVQNASATIGRYSSSSNNTADVSGAGALWKNTGNLYVGSGGDQNRLNILNGGNVVCVSGFIGGQKASAANAAVVSGSGSVWSNAVHLLVGYEGSHNSLTISNGAQVVCGNTGYIGSYSTAHNNTATITGSGSRWQTVGLNTGTRSNNNTLRILDGGHVHCTNSAIGNILANNNTVLVDGVGSEWRCSGNLYVGGASAGSGGSGNSITVANGGTLTTSTLKIYRGNSILLQPYGTINIAGNLTANNTSTTIECGINPTSHGKLVVGGTAALGGILEVTLLDGYSPAPGTTFDLFDWNGGVSGTFGTINLPALPFGLEWNTNALYSTGELSVELSNADSDGDNIADGWEYKYFSGDAAHTNNPDLDPHDNLAEYIAGTDPTNGNSYLVVTDSAMEFGQFIIEWEPVSNRLYDVLWSSNLVSGFQSLETNIASPQSSCTDTTHTAESEGFYLIEVHF